MLRAWREAAGERYAKRVKTLTLNEGELTIEIDSAAHLEELRNFTGENIRCVTNRRLGTERIRRVTFKLAR